MLKQIEISNYKSLAHVILDFEKENVVVGPNGVGKSNLLDAIHFVRDAARDGLDHAVTKRHGINSIRRWSKTRPYNVSIRLKFNRGEVGGEYKITIASAGGEFSVVEEELHWYGSSPFGTNKSKEIFPPVSSIKRQGKNLEISLPENPFGAIPDPSISEGDAMITQFAEGIFSPLAFFFRDLHESIVSCGAYSIHPNKIREPQPISNSNVLADDGSNLASVIRQMRATSHRHRRENLTLSVRQVLSILNEIKIDSAGGFYVPVFRVREIDSGYSHELNMSQLSDGTLRMLGMLTAFYQAHAPARITLEEPEQMIHPGLLPILVDAAKDYLDDDINHQVFFTTHSPNLLDMFKPESIISASFEDGVSKFRHMSERQIKIVKDKLFSPGELLVTEGFYQ